MHDIVDLKEKLAKTFAMKDLSEVEQIIRMKITRDKKKPHVKVKLRILY